MNVSGKNKIHQFFVKDLNFRKINWSKWASPHNEENKDAEFIETISDCYIYQYLLKPTHNWSTDNPSLTDLVLTNEAMQVSDIEYHAPLNKSND